MKTSSKISQEEKINIIFNYLFNGKSHIEEEIFWNTLSEKEINQLNEIKKEPKISFTDFQSSL